MKKVILATVLVLGATTAQATSGALHGLSKCLFESLVTCSQDLKVTTNQIADGLLDGSLTAEEAAIFLKTASEQAKNKNQK